MSRWANSIRLTLNIIKVLSHIKKTSHMMTLLYTRPVGYYRSITGSKLYSTLAGSITCYTNLQKYQLSLKYGVPQGSVLGPVFFKDYITPLADLIKSHNGHFHGYADEISTLRSMSTGTGVASKLRTKKQRHFQETEKGALSKLECCIWGISETR